MTADLSPANPRYCHVCGEVYSDGQEGCPTCAAPWSPFTPIPLPAVATLLGEFRGLREGAVISPDCYATLRRVYERRLAVLRPAAQAALPLPARPAPTFAPAPREPARPAPPRAASRPVGPPPVNWQPALPETANVSPTAPAPPPRRPRVDVGAWVAARQADILLYLGAFLLSIAALIFVGYQGDALSGPGRFAVLCAYTVGFLGLGLLLPRWERVREAADVFLALGALLVPVSVLALRNQVLAPGDLPDDVLLLLGSTLTAALYFALAARGHGRWYVLPGGVAVVAGWGALASVVGLDAVWGGAWYLAGVLLTTLVARVLPALRSRWLDLALAIIAVLALAFAQVVAVFGGEPTGQLPLSYLLLTLIVAESVNRRPRQLLALPPLVALTALTACWSAFGLGVEWYGAFAVLAGWGYLALLWRPVRDGFGAETDELAWSDVCAGGALGAGSLGLLLALALAAFPPAQPAALPLTSALALAGVAVLAWRWRPRLVGVLPALAAFTAGAGWRAAVGLDVGWSGLFVLGAVYGYLALAWLARRVDDGWAGAYGAIAAVLGALAGAIAHLAVAGVFGASDTAVLPITYGLLAAGCALVWPEPAARWLAPPLLALTALTAWWSAWGLPFAWYGAFAVVAVAGYVALAAFDRWPRASVSLWLSQAAAAAALALLLAHLGAVEPGAARPALAVTYGLVLAAAAVTASYWRRPATFAPLPLLTTLTAVTTLWAAEVAVVWWAYPALAVAGALLAGRPLWLRRPRDYGALAAAHALVLTAVTPLLLSDAYTDAPAHGLASALIGAGLLAMGAWALPIAALTALCQRLIGATDRFADRLDPDTAEHRTLPHERRLALFMRAGAGYAATLLLAVAGGYFNAVAGLTGAEQAWVFAALGVAGWAATAAVGQRWPRAVAWVGAVALGFSLFALVVSGEDAAIATGVAALGAVGPLLAFATTRRWALLVAATALAFTAVAFAWSWQAWDAALLPLAFAGMAAVLWATLLPSRLASGRTVEPERALAEQALAWGGWGVALLAGAAVTAERSALLPVGVSLVETRAWATFTQTLAFAATALAGEGVARRSQSWIISGTAALLVAGLCAIAIAQPGNVQAFTAPVAVYLLGLSLVLRRGHADWRDLSEGVTVLGLAVLLLPPAWQSFGPHSGLYGLEVLGIGAVLLTLGFALTARWFVVGGVLAVSGVGLRWLFVWGSAQPYWLTLGLAGMALLGIGLTLLLERDRWDRLRDRVTRWWERDATTNHHSGPVV